MDYNNSLSRKAWSWITSSCIPRIERGWNISQDSSHFTPKPSIWWFWWTLYHAYPSCKIFTMESLMIFQGLVNILLEHHTNIGDIISNRYLKVMWNRSPKWDICQKMLGLFHEKSQSKIDDNWVPPWLRKPSLYGSSKRKKSEKYQGIGLVFSTSSPSMAILPDHGVLAEISIFPKKPIHWKYIYIYFMDLPYQLFFVIIFSP